MIFLEERGSGAPPAPAMMKGARGAGEPEARPAFCPPTPAAVRPDWPAFAPRGTPLTPSGGDQPGLFGHLFGGKPAAPIDRRLAWCWAMGLVWALLILWAFYYLH